MYKKMILEGSFCIFILIKIGFISHFLSSERRFELRSERKENQFFKCK